MRKVLPVLLVLLLPSAALAQATLKVTHVSGAVQWKPAFQAAFSPLTASVQTVQIGDELKTGPDGNVYLEVPDGSYMVVSENTTLTIEDYWSPNLRSLVNLMVGKVRFYIQRLGGRPNPYRVNTPTALIAVRGTTFEVNVDEAQFAEVRCFEGRVTVETVGLSDREVILEQGRKTLVRPGEYPLPPVGNDEPIARNRVIRLVKKDAPNTDSRGMPSSVDVLARDNDRANRAADPLRGPASRTTDSVERGKPTLNFPNK
ncbi:MAG TPA: FecR family protein [Terriglobia bacterium]|nr:FecR family protein [Terriglobia bacterium]